MEEFVREYMCTGCVNEEKCKEYGVFCKDINMKMKGEKHGSIRPYQVPKHKKT